MEATEYNILRQQLRENIRAIERSFRLYDEAQALADLAQVRAQLQGISTKMPSLPSAVPDKSLEPDAEGRALHVWADRLRVELHLRRPPGIKKANRIRGVGLLLLGIVLLGGTIGMGEWRRWCSPEGLEVTYFQDRQLQHPVWRGVEMELFRSFRDWPPVWWACPGGFSSRWSGLLDVPRDDHYAFYAQSCDGLRLYLDGQCVLDHWRDQTWEASGRGVKWQLTKGPHPLVVEHYCRRTRDGALRIRWCGGGIPEDTVLAAPYLRKRP